uniref:Uncharacterized protein n=1 Tax=Solanum tuberosum TaxID=4113 RepID=M1DJK1_SOLTU
MALVIDDTAANSSAVSATTHVVQFNPVAQLPLKIQDYELFLKHQDLENPSSMITIVVVQKFSTPPQFNRNNPRFNNQP